MRSAQRKSKSGVESVKSKRSRKPNRIVLHYRQGAACPQCHVGRLDYNHLIELACDKCTFVLSGGAGCT